MDRTARNRALALILGSLTAVAGACASGEQQQPTEQQQAPEAQQSRPQDAGTQFGQAQTTPSQAEVTTREQVTRTVMRQMRIPSVRVVEERADINRMEPRHFEALGFPKQLSRNIVQYRQENKGFRSVDELREVNGMTDSLFNRFSGMLGASKMG